MVLFESNGTGLSHNGHVGTCRLLTGAEIHIENLSRKKSNIVGIMLIKNLWDSYAYRSYSDQYRIFERILDILLEGSPADYNPLIYNVSQGPEIPFTEI